MQYFKDSVTGLIFAFEADVVVTETSGVYAFATAAGAPLTGVPTTLSPCQEPAKVVPAPSIAQQATALLQTGAITLTSATTAALNGAYSANLDAQGRVTAVAAGIAAGLGLPHGAPTIPWQDTSGTDHAFTQAQFLEFGAALRDYAFALVRCTQGALTTLPSPALAIE